MRLATGVSTKQEDGPLARAGRFALSAGDKAARLANAGSPF